VEHREDWEVHLVEEAEAERMVTSGQLDAPGGQGMNERAAEGRV
jgi:hypothetical protein